MPIPFDPMEEWNPLTLVSDITYLGLDRMIPNGLHTCSRRSRGLEPERDTWRGTPHNPPFPSFFSIFPFILFYFSFFSFSPPKPSTLLYLSVNYRLIADDATLLLLLFSYFDFNNNSLWKLGWWFNLEFWFIFYCWMNMKFGLIYC